MKEDTIMQCPLDMYPYTIAPGDTLQTIATHFKVTIDSINKINGLGMDSTNLRAGQTICIPISYNQNKNSQSMQNNLNLNNRFRELWVQHVLWTRMLLISIVENLSDVNYVSERLLRNPSDFASLLKDYYGDEVASKFESLLRQHLLIAADLLKAAKAKDMKKAAELDKNWHDNADQMASFLASINPSWSESEWKQMLYQHLSLTEKEGMHRLNKNYSEEIKAYDDVENQAMKMADTMTEGIIVQFPKRF